MYRKDAFGFIAMALLTCLPARSLMAAAQEPGKSSELPLAHSMTSAVPLPPSDSSAPADSGEVIVIEVLSEGKTVSTIQIPRGRGLGVVGNSAKGERRNTPAGEVHRLTGRVFLAFIRDEKTILTLKAEEAILRFPKGTPAP